MSKKGKRSKRRKRKFKGRNRHHLVPKSRGGSSMPKNILIMKIDRHECWHKIFGNRTLDEVIRLLQRIQKQRGQA